MIDMNGNTVHEKAPMGNKRKLHGITMHDGTVYVIGGNGMEDGSPWLTSCEAYAVRDNSWSPIASLNEARYNCSVQAMPDGSIYVLGGFVGALPSGKGNVFFDSIECLDRA
jgi:hypothetical protein